MNRKQLEHAIRAAASISGEDRIVIIGSEKDFAFVRTMVAESLISVADIASLADELDHQNADRLQDVLPLVSA